MDDAFFKKPKLKTSELITLCKKYSNKFEDWWSYEKVKEVPELDLVRTLICYVPNKISIWWNDLPKRDQENVFVFIEMIKHCSQYWQVWCREALVENVLSTVKWDSEYLEEAIQIVCYLITYGMDYIYLWFLSLRKFDIFNLVVNIPSRNLERIQIYHLLESEK